MESLLCSFLCFGLYSYDLWTMGNLAKGPVKDLVTALLGLLLLTASAFLGIPALGWVLVTLLLLAYTFFYDQELFPLQWKQTILPGLVLTILTALGQAATGLRPHGLFPLRLSTLPFPWTVSLTLALCLTLQCQLAWKRGQLSPFAGAAWGALYLVLGVLPHFRPLPALCLGLGFGLFSVLEYTLRHYQTGYERSTRDFQSSVLTHQYEEIKTIYLNMRGWRHDYHNHIQVLKAHMAMGQLDALAGYLDALEQDLGQVDTYVKSGNLMVDAVLNSKLSLARQKDIALDCAAELPEQLSVSDVDLCVILGNLLDNAVEACEKIPPEGRFLRVYCAVVKHQLYLSVQNSAKEELDFDERNYISKKRGNHGLGMKRVKVLVDQYQGFLNLQNQPGIFAAEVLLPLTSPQSPCAHP